MVGIKDFDIPSCCSKCQMASCKGLSGQFYCDITTYDVDMDDTERDADCPLIEAIPKDQHEARLKADMVAMLTEILTDFDTLVESNSTRLDCESIVEQKIETLKE